VYRRCTLSHGVRHAGVHVPARAAWCYAAYLMMQEALQLLHDASVHHCMMLISKRHVALRAPQLSGRVAVGMCTFLVQALRFF
jgi:hypothetical protein